MLHIGSTSACVLLCGGRCCGSAGGGPYEWLLLVTVLFFFFFSSRRRHTRLQADWSSDMCSSDLVARLERLPPTEIGWFNPGRHPAQGVIAISRAEERRVGKECRSRWSPYH